MQCYAKCKSEKSEAKAVEDCPNPTEKREKPFCSKQSPYQVCKTECWKAKSGSNQLTELYGVDQLKKHNLSENGLISEALAKQRQNGSFGNLSSSMERQLGKIFQLDENPDGPVFGDTLATCVSEYIDLKKHDGFPCQCGRWDSNDTKIFMEQLGFSSKESDWRVEDEPMSWTMLNVCPDVSLKDFSLSKAVSE
jgi:hypothetical protein